MSQYNHFFWASELSFRNLQLKISKLVKVKAFSSERNHLFSIMLLYSLVFSVLMQNIIFYIIAQIRTLGVEGFLSNFIAHI